MLKLMKTLTKLITKLFSTATANRDHVSNKTVAIYMTTLPIYLNIFDESNNSSTLKDGFKKLCNRVNQCWSLIQQANMRNK